MSIDWTQVIIAFLLGVFLSGTAMRVYSTAKSKVTGG